MDCVVNRHFFYFNWNVYSKILEINALLIILSYFLVCACSRRASENVFSKFKCGLLNLLNLINMKSSKNIIHISLVEDYELWREKNAVQVAAKTTVTTIERMQPRLLQIVLLLAISDAILGQFTPRISSLRLIHKTLHQSPLTQRTNNFIPQKH